MTSSHDPWSFLKRFTHARIALGRAGHGTPTNEVLNFRLAHSKARDSVWSEVDFTAMREYLQTSNLNFVDVQSRCRSKQEFLLNPDLGRSLNTSSDSVLGQKKTDQCDLILVIADGLSAHAVHENGKPFVDHFMQLLKQSGLSLGPVVLAKYARVGLGDNIGEALGAKSVVMLIGERPGLASAESLSIYYTFKPRAENTDACRNCISNIHASGISPEGAAIMADHLIKTSFHRQLSGVDLKIEYPSLAKK